MTDSYFTQLDDYIATSKAVFEEQLRKLVNIPTVSADPAHANDIQRGAELAATLLEAAGLKAQIKQTAGFPVVLAEHITDPAAPTVTIYNHLDVQPADKITWHTDPFNLTKQDDKYFGRGATDDKGPALTSLAAVRYAIQQKLPLNFKYIWEFEEEIGSPNFEAFVRDNRAFLETDSIFVCDSVWISGDKPAIDYGLRGLVTFELFLKTGTFDTHSGLTGGAARNPLAELAQIVGECFDAKTGRVIIPGFYNDVVKATNEELDDFAASGFQVDEFMKAHGLTSLRTTNAREVLSRIMAEPTFEVHGFTGGYTGPGVKTVIAPEASVKLSTRLVSSQSTTKVFQLIKDFIQKNHPDVQVEMEAGLAAYQGQRSGFYAEAASRAVHSAFGTKPAFIREGGSIGAVLTMDQYLNAPVTILGLSLPSHGYHSTNEHYDWQQASGGIKMFAHYFEELSRKPE